MYSQGMGWKWPSERTDTEFLRGMGIAPCPDLPDPYFRDPPSPPDIPLTEKDLALLGGMHIQGWSRDTSPATGRTAPYVPPRSMREYLARYPMGVSAAVRSEAPRLGYRLTEDDVRLLTRRVIGLLREPVEDGPEDSVGMYAAVDPPPPPPPPPARRARAPDRQRAGGVGRPGGPGGGGPGAGGAGSPPEPPPPPPRTRAPRSTS